MGKIFDNVEVLDLVDSNLKDLPYSIHASKIIIDIDNDRIKVEAKKIYKDVNGNDVMTKDASYYITDEEQIAYWNQQQSPVLKPAIENRLKSNEGIV